MRCCSICVLVLIAGCASESADSGPFKDEQGDFGKAPPEDWGSPDAGRDLELDAIANASDIGPAGLAPDTGPLPNTTCASPTPLTLVGGSVTSVGDTTGAANGFSVDCSADLSAPMDGPQLYYTVKLLGGKNYRAVVTPTLFDVGIYAFPATTSCTAAAIDQACANPLPSRSNRYNADDIGFDGYESLRFAPSADEQWVIVVASWDSTEHGPFELTISEYTVPPHSSCAAPKVIPLTTSPVTVTGNTADAYNEFGTDIGCTTGFKFFGPQLYYQLNLAAGKTYTITITPTAHWNPALYAFTDGTCDPQTIQTQCTAWAANLGFHGDPETLTLSSATAATYYLAVDSSLLWDGGDFYLEISW